MLDAISLDHLRMFIAAADEGSFSAGGRRLRRAQSVISQTLANLEAQLGVQLFDRSSRSPVLTSQSLALLAEARAVVRERLLVVKMLFVASPTHPLASLKGPIPAGVLAQHRQLVLTDRTELSQGKEFGVYSANTWRLADLGAKHAFLRAGLGWGGMPVGVIETDLANGSLVKIDLEDAPKANLVMPMSAVFRTDRPPAQPGAG